MKKNPFIKTSLVVLIATAVAVVVCRADDQVPLKKAPPGVQATVKQVVGKNKFVSLDSDVENGKTVYEVDVEAKNASYSVHMTEAGEILGISLDIPMEIVPANVLAAAKTTHPDGKISEPEIRTVSGQMYYKLELMVGPAQHEMLIGADGKVISDETESESGGPDDDKKP
jgi:uncharacterized membrane protein YkoI